MQLIINWRLQNSWNPILLTIESSGLKKRNEMAFAVLTEKPWVRIAMK